MRFRLHKVRSREDLMLVFCKIDAIMEMMGLERFKNCNIYITPIDERGEEENLMMGDVVVKDVHISPDAYSFNKSPMIEDPDQFQTRAESESKTSNIRQHPLNKRTNTFH